MKEDAYRRTLKARAFDMARYLLPLATNTSLGQITMLAPSTADSRLLTSEYKEIRISANGYVKPPQARWNLTHEAAKTLHDEIAQLDPALANEPRPSPPRGPHIPTLVKYTAPSEYELRSRAELSQAAQQLMGSDRPSRLHLPSTSSRRPERTPHLEIDLATSLLYPHTHYSYRQLRGPSPLSPNSRL